MTTIVRLYMDVTLTPDAMAQHLLETMTPGNVDERCELEYSIAQAIREHLHLVYDVDPFTLEANMCPGVTLVFDKVAVEREIPMSALEPGPGTEDTQDTDDDAGSGYVARRTGSFTRLQEFPYPNPWERYEP